MSARILLVEDEENLHEVIRLNLDLEGHEVVSATDGKMALEKYTQGNYNLILLDVMLPHYDGFEICVKIREHDKQTPILFLTARGTSEDRINGLKIGADDYLVKPFHLEELLLRVRNLLQRGKITENTSSTALSDRFSFGDFTIDFNTYEIFDRGDKKAELTKREILLLKLLITQAGKVVSREEILDKIWGEDVYPSSRTIDNYILAFRKYFEKNPREPRYFHSIRGVGYKFTP